MMTPIKIKIEIVFPAGDTLCECPTWHPARAELFWVDIDAGHLQKWSARNGHETILKRDYSIGSFALTETDDLILGTRKGIEWLHMEQRELDVIHSIADTPRLRFNDGKVDHAGRFWVGTMPMTGPEFPLGLGALYRLDTDFSLHKMDEGICLSNGMDWTAEQDKMIYADTTQGAIFQYDFMLATGQISNRTTLIQMDREFAVPDGLTLDEDDFIWVACPKRGMVLRYAPDGTLDRRIDVGTPSPTSVCFGGPDMATLFITTARHQLPEANLSSRAGAILACRPGVRGRAGNVFRGQFR